MLVDVNLLLSRNDFNLSIGIKQIQFPGFNFQAFIAFDAQTFF